LRSGRRRSGTTLGRVDTAALGVQRTPYPSLVSCVWNVETLLGSVPPAVAW
jgi:hypothetical protein